LLGALGPEAVSVELSFLGLRWREQNSAILLQRLERLVRSLPPGRRNHHRIRLIRETLRIPFEFTAARAYADRHGLPCHLVDLNRISRENLPLFDSEIVNPKNLGIVVREEDRRLPDIIGVEQRRAARCLRGELSLAEAGVRTDWNHAPGRLREAFLACRIRKLAAHYGTMVHVGGWVHLMEDREGRSLASLLVDLSPDKVLLGDPSPGPA
jgi:hypothetical protein